MSSRLPAVIAPPAEILRPPGDTDAVYLHPGKIIVSAESALISTIVGSCVAVCMFDEGRRVGGMNHYLLPHWTGVDSLSPRYGSVAISRLIELLVEKGARRSSLQAKVFGGAAVMQELTRSGRDHVGLQNSQVAAKALDAEGIPVVASDTGGNRGRKVLFECGTGAVRLKYV